MNRSEQMLFALLRASLHEREAELTFFQGATADDWKQCHQIAVAQGVMALAWGGVLRLSKELQPPISLKLTWAMAVERYEAKYLRYCKTVDELSTFYAAHGIATIQLKGVGFSTYYPVPSHREGGDIDIYTYSADTSKLSDTEANRLADTLMEQQGIEVDHHSPKHSNFYYKGIPIENHRTFVNVTSIKEAVLAEKILQRELKPRMVELTEGKVQIPSPAFNALFIAFHALQHYGNGIALHHLCDWAMILKHYGLLLPGDLDYKPFLQGVYGMTQICNRYLGTSVPVSGGEKVAKEMFEEIMHPKYASIVPANNKIGIVFYKLRRLLYKQKLKKTVFDESLAGRLWISIKYHIRKPQSIFSKKQI